MQLERGFYMPWRSMHSRHFKVRKSCSQLPATLLQLRHLLAVNISCLWIYPLLRWRNPSIPRGGLHCRSDSVLANTCWKAVRLLANQQHRKIMNSKKNSVPFFSRPMNLLLHVCVDKKKNCSSRTPSLGTVTHTYCGISSSRVRPSCN